MLEQHRKGAAVVAVLGLVALLAYFKPAAEPTPRQDSPPRASTVASVATAEKTKADETPTRIPVANVCDRNPAMFYVHARIMIHGKPVLFHVNCWEHLRGYCEGAEIDLRNAENGRGIAYDDVQLLFQFKVVTSTPAVVVLDLNRVVPQTLTVDFAQGVVRYGSSGVIEGEARCKRPDG